MRDFKGMKRQRGRNRGGGGNNPPNKQNANRAFESNGPENLKVRGHAQHVYEKYQQLARDAASASDRVLAENFLQHAEHYYRVLRMLQPQRPASDFVSRDPFASGFDAEIEDFPEGAAEAETSAPGAEPRQEGGGDSQDQQQNGGDRYEREPRRFERDREYRDRPERDNRGEREFREPNGQRQDRDQRDRERDAGQPPRADRFEARRDRDDRYPRESRGERVEPRRDDSRDRPQSERDRPQGENRDRYEGEARGDRPRRDRDYPVRERPGGRYGVRDEDGETRPSAEAPTTPATEDGPVLRSQDGGAFEAPAFLTAATSAPAPSSDTSEEAAPVRKRAPRRKKTDEAATESQDA